MEESREKGRQDLRHESAGFGNLLSPLLPREAKETSTCRKEGALFRAHALADDYVFSLAGHETTCNTLAFAIYLLAAYPEVQA